VFRREVPSRSAGMPPVVQRAYRVFAWSNGRVWEQFHTRARVDQASRIVTIEPFPIDALHRLVREVEEDHVRERQVREDQIAAQRRGARTP
jgi:hypothetical protein